ncbi:Hypothetical predicted protein [Mytilus galloprovincialis]|uniref:C2H2-type domain-containing protein n=1 Tax=Mytilus galloprovincialis TaxID=29158 RepID=A0A8B6GRK7_MYTGA|nr:Hypothetical predicted protein [Mytilus galloprovincialis]
MQYNFSEGQSGKDLCDSKTSHSKLHMLRFADEEDGIYAKRAYNVGPGKFMKNADLNIAELNELKHFQIIKPFPNVLTRPGHVSLKTNAEQQDVVQISVNDQPDVECIGYPCTEPGCTKEFLTGRGLEQHILTGIHDFSKRPATDSVKQRWIDKCNSLNANFFSANSEFENNANEDVINEDWGLKRPKTVVRFSKKLKDFLYTIFEQGENTGKRPCYEDICDRLKKERSPDGCKLFTPKEWFSTNQVRSLLGNFTSKKTTGLVEKRVKGENIDDADEVVDDADLKEVLSNIEFLEQQDQLQTLSSEIVASCSV